MQTVTQAGLCDRRIADSVLEFEDMSESLTHERKHELAVCIWFVPSRQSDAARKPQAPTTA